MALIKHGAAIFATTFSDGSLAIEKCDPYREGYNECFSYLAGEGEGAGEQSSAARRVWVSGLGGKAAAVFFLNHFPCHLSVE